ncbi:MAG: TIGR04290 family methyltransferase [Bacteroidota bacterium]|nr:TIGR04290 family methyltransferase [Bacteroidota bacterium]
MIETLETFIRNPKTPVEHKIAELGPWFHNLHLLDGTQTAPDHPLGDFPFYKWQSISSEIPKNLKGWTVLDIGCNAGYYSFEMAKRGAVVTGIDIDSHYLRQARWASRQLGLKDKVTFRQMQIYELSQIKESFDIILFMGVFYHLRYPLLALDIVSRKFKKLLIFQSLTMPGDDVLETPDDLNINDRKEMLKEGWPKMAFIEKSLSGDDTNWWAPNHSAIIAMLHSAGLKILSHPEHEIYLCSHSRTRKTYLFEKELNNAFSGLIRSGLDRNNSIL